nr:MAG TPA: hypothetical protein [Bacteriophage sp.]
MFGKLSIINIILSSAVLLMCNPLLLYPFVMVAKSVSTGILKEVILVTRLPSSSKSIILSFFKLE